jgi:hypothetical protein
MTPKLFMILLGSKARNRNVEQHDFFFGIGDSLQSLVPAMQDFWPEAGSSLHIDGWREIHVVEGHRVNIFPKTTLNNPKRLFFINLGGYQSGKLEEQHYTLLTVQEDRKNAIKASTATEFFKSSSIEKIKSASAHIDEKYGIDVDEIYRVDELLSETDKVNWQIELTPDDTSIPDEIHLGYYPLDRLH